MKPSVRATIVAVGLSVLVAVPALAQQRTLEADANQKSRAAEAAKHAAEKEGHRQHLAALTVGLKPVNIFMDVAVTSAPIRDLPARAG